MTKEFVSYEQSLTLKELGFDEPCIKYYWTDGMFVKGYEEPFNYNKRDNVISAPLYQQAFRWFREKHGLYSIIHCPTKKTAVFTITGFDVLIVYSMQKLKTYEEAESACLDKLIETCKNK